ncbi:unnamed protein product, partial [Ectocarpus sp. 6 AP-2014]
ERDLFSKPSYKRSFRSQPHQHKQHQHQHQQGPTSLKGVLDLELVWNRQRGQKGSLRLGEVIEAIAGIDSQILRPVCEELRRRAASVGESRLGEGGEREEEEDTFVSLRTNRRTLDLKFSTVPIRNRFMLAFKTLAWETAAAKAGSSSGRGSRPVGSSHF